MERQVRVLSRLIDDLLDISRISIGRIELRRERVDVGRVVAEVVETERPLFQGSGRSVTVVVPDAPIHIHADSVRFSQIVTNLLANAVKYTDPGGHITLRVRVEGTSAVLRSRTTGSASR
jgi:signal transduction histidine kinase